MQYLTKSLILLLTLHFTFLPAQQKEVGQKVFICDNGKTKKYHLINDCRGLSQCTHRIIEIELADAKKNGMSLCGFEK